MSNVVSVTNTTVKQSNNNNQTSDSSVSHHHHYQINHHHSQILVQRDDNQGYNHRPNLKRSAEESPELNTFHTENIHHQGGGIASCGSCMLYDNNITNHHHSPVTVVGGSLNSALNQNICQSCTTSTHQQQQQSSTSSVINQNQTSNNPIPSTSSSSQQNQATEYKYNTGPTVLSCSSSVVNQKLGHNKGLKRANDLPEQPATTVVVSSHCRPSTGAGEARQVTPEPPETNPHDEEEEEEDEDDERDDEDDSDNELNFDYEPVLTKILNEKKLALSNLPDVNKFLSSFQQKIGQHNNIELND